MKAGNPELAHGLLGDPRGSRWALNKVRDAIEEARGNLVHAAHELGVSHRTMLRWIKRHPELRSARVRAKRASTMQVVQGEYDIGVVEKGADSEGSHANYDIDALADSRNASKDEQ